jgi:transposase
VALAQDSPGQHESAGKHKSGKTPARQPLAGRRPRRRHHGRIPHQKYHLPRRPLPAPRTPTRQEVGKKKAIVALEHSILTAVWHLLTHDVDYHDLGGDYFTQHNPDRTIRNIIRQANALGLAVRFDPIQAA